MQIVMKVLLVEARTSLLTGATIAIGTILGILQWQVVSAVVDSVISPSVMDIIVIRQVL
mgnify:CR=1 FL=1